MIKEAILKLAKKQDLTYAEAEAVMNEIMGGEATPVQMSSYLTHTLLNRFGFSCDVERRPRIQADRLTLCTLLGACQDRPCDLSILFRCASL